MTTRHRRVLLVAALTPILAAAVWWIVHPSALIVENQLGAAECVLRLGGRGEHSLKLEGGQELRILVWGGLPKRVDWSCRTQAGEIGGVAASCPLQGWPVDHVSLTRPLEDDPIC